MTIECLEFRPHDSGALQGFANFRVPKMGVEIFGCGVFMKSGHRWVSMPSREYQDKETGEKRFISIMRFIDKEHGDAFSKAALQALDEWCAKNAQEPPSQGPCQEIQGELPF